ncbi:MAG: hypothetical protein QFX32_00855 [Methanolinea sp.]|nr:hypothetical protein [Methanolinea sp.]
MRELNCKPLIAAVCLVLFGIFPAVHAAPVPGSLISSTTSVSGNAVVNETVSVKKITYTGGFPTMQEWRFHSSIANPQGKTWSTEAFFAPGPAGVRFTFTGRGGLFPPFSLSL